MFHLFEHQELNSDVVQTLESEGIKIKKRKFGEKPSFLGITTDMKTSYFIGAEWINKEKNLYLVVNPKKTMENVDFFKMFCCCLEYNFPTEYFEKIYGIRLTNKNIPVGQLQHDVTPLLFIHFLTILKRIVKKGLKKDYILIEDNLTSKIKGKIMSSPNLTENVLKGRLDRTYCRYQVYTENTPENQLLKQALLFAARYLAYFRKNESYTSIKHTVSTLLLSFENVDSHIDFIQIRKATTHAFYKDYKEGIHLAKIILQRFGYSIDKTDQTDHQTPPFWIDMSRLYEVYVYHLLEKAYPGKIKFQVGGYGMSAVDFIKTDEGLIIDTKYRPKYQKDRPEHLLKDVRQISGYARDENILSNFNRAQQATIPPCLIIYPEKQDEDDKEITSAEDFKNKTLLELGNPIKYFKAFYKMGVKLPMKQTP